MGRDGRQREGREEKRRGRGREKGVISNKGIIIIKLYEYHKNSF